MTPLTPSSTLNTKAMDYQEKRMEAARKPKKCPTCRKGPVATILYGLPAFDEDMKRQMDEGEIILGGCCITMDDPAWECTQCHQHIYRKA